MNARKPLERRTQVALILVERDQKMARLEAKKKKLTQGSREYLDCCTKLAELEDYYAHRVRELGFTAEE